MFQNHEGGREVNFQHSEDYKDQIKLYWEARGYDLVEDSVDDNDTADLIFRKTHEHGDEDVYVEAKYSKVSRTNDGFLTEVGRYFFRYLSDGPFEFHVFARDLSNISAWRKIFDPGIQRDSAVREFYERIREDANFQPEEKQNFEEARFEKFLDFVSSTKIHKASYEVLKMDTDRLQNSDKYQINQFISEREPLNEASQLNANFGKLDPLPTNLYVGFLDSSVFDSRVQNTIPRTAPFWFENNRVYSLRPPDEFPGPVERTTEMDTVSVEPFSSWAQESENKLGAKTLLMKEICRNIVTREFSSTFNKNASGEYYESDDYCQCVKYRGDYYLLFKHPSLAVETQHVEDQLITKVFDEEDTFVRHRSAKLKVHDFAGRFYLSILVRNHFTESGGKRTLIRGPGRDRLTDKFNQNDYTNSQAFSEYRHWRKILGMDKTTSANADEQEIGLKKIGRLSVGKRPPEDRQEVEERDTSQQQKQLGDFQ
ncbi:hypothetical protein EGO51_18570 [Haloarcula hispanica]|uniref:Uncharacterized protein n=1 Tax=Haloarcula hispanica TaxID=51589 RepID=A0A5J5LES1_HALHI|nr:MULTISPECIES: hypothetical protein [Haloarcula]AJF27962.1 hypothetical protein SG26_19570 [Haloarcula sp. CBA1115]KAA9404709.1 hypothetical protein EGO51_18570 [Haloarcula hispanica]MUV49763.1 hypothetical protein [Haloarcula sp. CBA1122]